jgi:predicted nuclease of predicted toxin-antitoxin system
MRFLADENFNNRLLSGLLAALPELDVIRVQDTEIYEAPDPVVLEWAAREGRILLTHDVQTMPGFAASRVKAGLPMPGVIIVAQDVLSYGKVIEELAIIIGAGTPEDFENLVKFVPIH